jgi:flagellar biosynthesis/type III secretory pathway M-ring protein FliF/YscJ
MKQIEALAAAAIGVDPQRNDTIVVQNLSFQEMPVEQPSLPSKTERARRILVEWSGLLRYVGVTFLFVFVYLIMLRPIKKQILAAFRELPARLQRTGRSLEKGEKITAEIELPQASEQGRVATALKRELTDKVKAEPAAASRLLQNWIREDA